jgi:hypothetical protein
VLYEKPWSFIFEAEKDEIFLYARCSGIYATHHEQLLMLLAYFDA